MSEFENAIEIKGLTKKYDGYTLDNVSFSVPKGTIMGFVGQNGAGKSTTIKAILHIIDADGGDVKILGMDYLKDEKKIKEEVAVVFDEMPFQEGFTANAINKMFSGFFANWSEETFFAYLDRFGLPRKKKIGKFSKGMKMKLQIATALSRNAKLLIMDEATTGLDPIVRNEMLDVFREYLQDEEKSILMSSHITSDLEKIADGITFIDKGKILLCGYKDEIIENHGIIKCTKEDFEKINRDDFISARVNDFGVEIMVNDRFAIKKKYTDLLIEKTNLEEIMLFYVNKEKKEWW